MPSLGASYGRGAATTTQWDLANADCVVIMGSNMAENHPVAFRFIMAAKERGAIIIHAAPRFTRTSALADSAPGLDGGDRATHRRSRDAHYAARMRAGDVPRDQAGELLRAPDATNAALSLAIAVEHPLAGIHRGMLEQSRDALQAAF